MARLLSHLIVEVWDRVMSETPSRLHSYNPFLAELGWGPRMTYRERLDEQPRNWRGELIPRIVTVRRNLRRLKSGY